jgi:integrase
MSGDGSIFQTTNSRGKTVWAAEVTMGTRRDGTRIRRRLTAKTLAEAKRLRRQLILERETIQTAPATQETLQEYGMWLIRNIRAQQVRLGTAFDYEYRFRHWILPTLGKYKMTEITTRDIETWMLSLRHAGYATTTINGARAVLNIIFKHALKTSVIEKNPVDAVATFRKPPGEATQVQPPWTTEEFQTALMRAMGHPAELIVVLGAMLGLRISEIAGLTWDDVSFTDATLKIRRGLREIGTFDDTGAKTYRLHIDETKTQQSLRTLKLGSYSLAVLQRHREHIQTLRTQAGTSWQESPWLYPSTTGTHIQPARLRKLYKKFCQENELRSIRVHDMRHTAAAMALESGVRLEAVTQGLGHSSTEFTKRTYAPYVQKLSDEFTVGLDTYVMTSQHPELSVATLDTATVTPDQSG